ncbi:MAG: TadE/TadG family type IV pilus assembly protein [Planctomycetota bacterium]|nr:TadE/TadG family type IV pilus assembly protein [Planctomycetota bacterium]
MKRNIHHLRNNKGSASVEFCITMPLYLGILLGILFFGQATFVDQEMSQVWSYATYNRDYASPVLTGAGINTQHKAVGGYVHILARDNSLTVQASKTVDATRSNAQVEFSNFNQLVPADVPAGEFAEWVDMRFSYTYQPGFLPLVYGDTLSQKEYMTLSNRQTPNQDFGGQHGSHRRGTNLRLTPRLYRGYLPYRQKFTDNLPAPGEESELWNNLKVKDMLELEKALNGGAGSQNAFPPADNVVTGLDNLDRLQRYPRWNRAYVEYYGEQP